jgi:hypothetical protein
MRSYKWQSSLGNKLGNISQSLCNCPFAKNQIYFKLNFYFDTVRQEHISTLLYKVAIKKLNNSLTRNFTNEIILTPYLSSKIFIKSCNNDNLSRLDKLC